jgi:hypothetical protein
MKETSVLTLTRLTITFTSWSFLGVLDLSLYLLLSDYPCVVSLVLYVPELLYVPQVRWYCT